MAEKTIIIPSILSDAVERIAALARRPLEDSQEIVTKDFFGRPYYKRNGIPTPVEYPEMPLPTTKNYHSLDALITMVREEALALRFPCMGADRAGSFDGYAGSTLFLVVNDERNVSCRTSSNLLDYQSATLYKSYCDIVGSFKPGVNYSHEAFMIALRSQFQPSEDRDYLLTILSSVSSQATVKSEDSGLAQQVSVNKGICNVKMEPIKSIVRLRPYRTFQEVEQPESEFLVRLTAEENGSISIALHEADGGMWRLDARRAIADYLSDDLANEINSGLVVVTP